MNLNLTVEERLWLGLCSPKKKKRKTDEIEFIKQQTIFIGEIMATAQSLSKGTNIIQKEDPIEIVRLNTFTLKKSKSFNRIRLKNLRTNSEFASINQVHASFLSTLLELNMCDFKLSIIYAPENIKIWDELIISIKIWLNSKAFEDLNNSNTNLLSSRKLSLEYLFEKTGLLNQKQKSLLKLSDELSGKDLSKIYSNAALLDRKFNVLVPAHGMALKLREYQGVALGFMLSKETDIQLNTTALSPLWIELTPENGQAFYYNSYSGQVSLIRPCEDHCRGGILADDMGLGKTIEILALIHTNKYFKQDIKNDQIISQTTLIVCPLNLIFQWQEEAKRCFPNIKNPALVYYGSERKSISEKQLILITTYGTLSSEFDSNPDSILFNTKWWRIVLDEAHLIKEKSTKSAKACFALEAVNRWAVTGTPIINKLDDLYSIIKFLKVNPWSRYSFWNSFVTVPFENKNAEALDVVQTILEPLIIRRTKDMKDENGNAIVPLPSKHSEIVYLEFAKEERELYQQFNMYSKKKLQELKRIGKADYIHIFTLLLRMRQICNHKLLVTCKASDSKTATELSDLINKHEKTEFRETFLENLNETKECPICFEASEDDILLPCLHTLCKSCLNDLIEQKQQKAEELECPFCRKPCQEKDLLQILQKETIDDAVVLRKFGFSMSTKLTSLVQQIKTLQKDFKDEKIIVFSQWSGMLDLIGLAFDENEIESTRLDGKMSKSKRQENLHKFKNTKIPVLLATLRSTGVGLNLTEASRVFLMDPWWNESVENQAIDRLHRIGQTRDVYVKRFIIKDSVEEKMLDIQKRKTKLVNALTSDNGGVTLDELMSFF